MNQLTCSELNNMVITKSRLEKAQECLYFDHLAQDLCLYPVGYETPLYFTQGNEGHYWLETGNRPKCEDENGAKMNGIIDAYEIHYAGQLNCPGEKEFMFCVPVKDYTKRYSIFDYYMAGITDGLDHDKNELWEHKFLSQITGSYLDEISISLQRIYNAILGVELTLYNLVKKPGIKLKQKQTIDEYRNEVKEKMLATPQEYFTRMSARVTLEQQQEIIEYFVYMTKQIRDCQKEKYWPKNYGGCFGKYNTKCRYLPICTAQNPDFVIEDRFIKNENLQHAELKRRVNNGNQTADGKEQAPF